MRTYCILSSEYIAKTMKLYSWHLDYRKNSIFVRRETKDEILGEEKATGKERVKTEWDTGIFCDRTSSRTMWMVGPYSLATFLKFSLMTTTDYIVLQHLPATYWLGMIYVR